ncbi:alcohol dehydrogenase catalytic domain-containing protein [soil metagenome]
MHALYLDAPGKISLREVPVPEPGEGEILIKVRAATTDGTDLKAWRRGHPQIPMPGPFGHEWSGDVAVVGAGTRFVEGDAVMGVHTAPCGHCFWCRRGQENLCETIMATKVLGSYAEYLLIPKRIADVHVFPKPDILPYEQAALLEPLACVAQGVMGLDRRVPEAEGEPRTALIIGPGAIGLMFSVALMREGWQVTLAGRNPDRLAIAEEMGVNTVLLSSVETERGFDAVVECTGQVEVWERSVDYVRRGGTAMLFGGPPGGTKASFDTHRLHYDEIELISPFHFGRPAVAKARDWLLGGLDLSLLISGDRQLEEAQPTFEDLEAGRGIKFAFRPDAERSE